MGAVQVSIAPPGRRLLGRAAERGGRARAAAHGRRGAAGARAECRHRRRRLGLRPSGALSAKDTPHLRLVRGLAESCNDIPGTNFEQVRPCGPLHGFLLRLRTRTEASGLLTSRAHNQRIVLWPSAPLPMTSRAQLLFPKPQVWQRASMRARAAAADQHAAAGVAQCVLA